MKALMSIGKLFRRNSGGSRFLIVCAGRTGSTMLRLMLNSHPEICCHGEVFSLPVMRGFVGLSEQKDSPIRHMLQKIRIDDSVSFLYDFVFYPGTYPVVGAKIVYSTLQQHESKKVFDKILLDRDIRIVHLIRENRLKRYVSHYIASRVTHVQLAFTPDALPKPVRIKLSPHECIEDIVQTEKLESQFRECFKKHKVFEISYEQIVDDRDVRLDELQKFMGVAPMKLEKKTLKLNPDSLEDLIENYLEFKKELDGAGYGCYFER